MVLLLVAAIWQAKISDWFTHADFDNTAYQQRWVNRVELDTLIDLSDLSGLDDPQQRQILRDNIRKRIEFGNQTIDETEASMKRLDEGQAQTLSNVRFWLFVLGASLVICGKWLVMSHKAQQGRS